MHADLCLEFSHDMTPEMLATIVDNLGRHLQGTGALVKFDIEVTPLDQAAIFMQGVAALHGAKVIPANIGGQLIWDPAAPADKTD